MTTALVALCAILAACDSGSSATATATATATAPATSAASTSSEARCRELAGTNLSSATIEKTEHVSRGTQLLGFFKRTFIKVFVFSGLPDLTAPTDFCRVTAKLRPVPGSQITAELWLPPDWNGKLLAMGGGGFNGGIGSAALMLIAPLKKGYVAMATDAGHEDTNSAKFTHDFPEQYTDYAYRANHVAAEFAKELAASYYKTPVKQSYFHGCSNGGRDALMEARRFPQDYDGIIAGAPAAAWSELMTSFAWNAQAVERAPKLKDKLKLVQSAAIARCDAIDGVKDQLIENPAACAFDPAELQCSDGNAADCLSTDQVTALRRIYEGPRLGDGTQVYPGMPVGGEALESNWDTWIVKNESVQSVFALESFRWMLYRDAKWELSSFDIDRDYPAARERITPVMNSDDPDLGAFIGRGGKLLLYHGWNDAAIPAGATIEYYRSLRERLGPVVENQVRLFMVPGMMHCAGGVGPSDFDLIDQIDRWVQSGTPPERIIASEYDPPAVLGPAPGAKLVRTRPLCVWPKVAHYIGSGSTDNATNFRCE